MFSSPGCIDSSLVIAEIHESLRRRVSREGTLRGRQLLLSKTMTKPQKSFSGTKRCPGVMMHISDYADWIYANLITSQSMSPFVAESPVRGLCRCPQCRIRSASIYFNRRVPEGDSAGKATFGEQDHDDAAEVIFRMPQAAKRGYS